MLVAKRAIIESNSDPFVPNTLYAIWEKGAFDCERPSQPSILTELRATSIYNTVLIIMANIIPFGMFLWGSFTSSESFTISSKPRKAKKIRAADAKIPLSPRGASR